MPVMGLIYLLLWIIKANYLSLFVFFISLLIVAQNVSGYHVPIIRSWRLRDVIASFWYVPWLQGGCQDRLAGSASMDGFLAQRVFFIFLLIVAQHVSGNHVPIIRSWRLRDVIALCWYVPWLQEGGQDRLRVSASMDVFIAQSVFFISLLIVAQHVSGNHVPIIRIWWLRYVIALCWYVPWLEGGCQDRLAGSASMDLFVSHLDQPYIRFTF